MSKYSFSQLIIEILSQIQGARAKVYNDNYPLSPSNAGVAENFITTGGATLADFFVAPPRRALFEHAIVFAPQNQTQGRRLQLRKENI